VPDIVEFHPAQGRKRLKTFQVWMGRPNGCFFLYRPPSELCLYAYENVVRGGDSRDRSPSTLPIGLPRKRTDTTLNADAYIKSILSADQSTPGTPLSDPPSNTAESKRAKRPPRKPYEGCPSEMTPSPSNEIELINNYCSLGPPRRTMLCRSPSCACALVRSSSGYC